MRRSVVALSLAIACRTAEAPVPLPDPLPPAPQGRWVKAGPVEGFLVRPRTDDGPWPGVLLLPQLVDATARQQAESMAADGRIVLVIGPTAEIDRAERYLAAMPSTSSTSQICQRAVCP